MATAIIKALPAGIVPDSASDFGVQGLNANVNKLVSEGISTITTAGTNTTLTTDQLFTKNIVLTSGASGGFTLTLPTTSAIFSALGPTIGVDGNSSFPLYICNQGTSQTMTLTAGDSSTTVSSTENTLATNISGKWIVNITTASTLTVTRVFGGTN